MISYLGKGLNITISCDHVPGHNWMSYLCWYSIKQNLPDANISMVCKRENVSGNLFLWTKKLNIPFRMYGNSFLDEALKHIDVPNLVVPPYCMCVRDFEEASFDPSRIKEDVLFVEGTNLVCSASSDEFSPFCSYKIGWGHFITSDWIHKEECPLYFAIIKKLSKQGMSLNEKKIENLWSSSLKLFQMVSGGVIR
jgi:hypothetical protein